MKLADIKRLKPGTIITLISCISKGEDVKHIAKGIPRIIQKVTSTSLLIDLPKDHKDYGKEYSYLQFPKASELESNKPDEFTIVTGKGEEWEYRLCYRVETHN